LIALFALLPLANFDVVVDGFLRYLRRSGTIQVLGASTGLYDVTVLSFQIVLGVLFLLWVSMTDVAKNSVAIFYVLVGVLSFFFALVFWNPQHLIWLLPLLVLYHGLTERHWTLYWAVSIGCLFWTLVAFGSYYAASGQGFLFVPVSQGPLREGSNFLLYLFNNYSARGGVTNLLANVLRSAISGAFLFYVYLAYRALTHARPNPW
jgi:hypothetical protein